LLAVLNTIDASFDTPAKEVVDVKVTAQPIIEEPVKQDIMIFDDVDDFDD
jgi:hypothetical protein